MPNNIIITPGSASIQFSGSANNDTIRLQVEPSGSVAFYGNSGSLFSITDQLSGSLMSVNDISGLPILEVFSDNRVVMGTFNQNTLVVTGSRVGIDKAVPTADLDVSGSVFITGSLRITGSQTLNGTLQVVSGTISSSGPQSGLYIDSISSNPNLTILSEPSYIRYYAINGSHMFRVGGVDALQISEFSTNPISDNQATIGTAGVRWGTGFINNIRSSGSITNTGSLDILSGSINITNGGITSSLFGTSSWATTASFALSSSRSITSSFAISASWAPSAPGGGITQLIAGDGLTGGTITSTGTITLDTGSVHFLDGVKKELNTETVVSSSTFSSPSQGTVRAVINGVQTDVDTGLQTGDSPQFTNLTVSNIVTASIISASTAITASNVRLNGLTDITSANKVLVLNTATNQIFTTASVGGGAGSAFPFNGTAVVTGSLLVSQSVQGVPALQVSGGVEFRSGSVRVFSAVDGGTFGGFYVDSGTGDIAIEAGGGAYIGSNTSDVNLFAQGVGAAAIGTQEIRPATNLVQSLGTSTIQWNRLHVGTVSASTAVITPIISASTSITASHVQLNGLTDTTQANKVLVINTATNKIFTTSSVGGGGGGSGNGFPYDGTVTPAIISGSLIISSSINSPVIVSGSVNDFFELEVVNFNAGNNASSDVVVSSNNTTDLGNYAAFGINSTTYNAGLVGGASDGYIYLTSSVGELHIGNASPVSTGNVRIFAGGPNSDATTRIFISSSGHVGIGTITNLTNILNVNGSITASAVTSSFTGPIVNISELSMTVSGSITASGTTGVALDLNKANYFTVSGSGTGTITWTVTNVPPAGRAQTFIIEYTNGGIKTNSWFTNTRWPGGIAPTLTSASANPDILGFTTDDSGANWRGVLLQRASA